MVQEGCFDFGFFMRKIQRRHVRDLDFKVTGAVQEEMSWLGRLVRPQIIISGVIFPLITVQQVHIFNI